MHCSDNAWGALTFWCNCICTHWWDQLRLLSLSVHSMQPGRWIDMKTLSLCSRGRCCALLTTRQFQPPQVFDPSRRLHASYWRFHSFLSGKFETWKCLSSYGLLIRPLPWKKKGVPSVKLNSKKRDMRDLLVTEASSAIVSVEEWISRYKEQGETRRKRWATLHNTWTKKTVTGLMKESKFKSGARYNTKSLQQSVKNCGGSVGGWGAC